MAELQATINRRSAVSHRAVWLGLSALAVGLLAVFGAGYWLLVKYEPRAAEHIPARAQGAFRVDVEQVVLYEPIRRHVFPVLDGRAPSGNFDGGGRLELFKELAGVNLGMDLREVVGAALPGEEWVLLIGGLFPESGLPEAIAEVLRRSNASAVCSMANAELVCPGALFGQAADGVLVVASSREVLAESLVGSDWARRNGLPNTPIAATVPLGESSGRGGGFASLQRAALLLQYAGVGWLPELKSLTLRSDLGDPLRVELALDGLAPERAEQVQQAVELAQGWASDHPGADLAGERGVLARVSVLQADGRPVLVSSWPRQDIDRAAARAAEALSAIVGTPTAAAE